MTLNDTRQKFLDFFRSKERAHAIIPSSSLVPEDKTVLFVTAGMQPLVPYLMGEKKHPDGARLANAQKCLRTDDILEVGDNRHLTFFEMLGNWSLGDSSAADGIGAGYFKKESIEWSFELLTSKEWFGIDPSRIYVSVFEGNDAIGVPLDNESIGYWEDAFARAGIEANLENGRIRAYPMKKNWWELPGTGPCGPDTEIFYDTHPNFPLEVLGGQAGNPHDPTLYGPRCHQNCDCGRFVEIWNNVFMEYEKKIPPAGGGSGGYVYAPLAQKNVDTGMGLERIAMVLQGKETVFHIDSFTTPFNGLPLDESSGRIIADHLRATVFLLADGVRPSNKDSGYILRRLIRRSLVRAEKLFFPTDFLVEWLRGVIRYYSNAYPELMQNEDAIIDEFKRERDMFSVTLERGLKEFDKRFPGMQAQTVVPGKKIMPFIVGERVGEKAFDLYQTYGFPKEVIKELLEERLYRFDEIGFDQKFKKHQEVSRAGAEKKFGGHGMKLQTGELKAADDAELEKVTRLHTATHLLQAALRQVLGDHVRQKGSDITAERLRFDFIHSQKMTDEEKKRVEDIVNAHIAGALPVMHEEMAIDDAEKTNALMFNKEKYGNTVTVYAIGDKENAVSRELCGGPHVDNTKSIGRFTIIKEEASSAGVRRIRATVQ